MKQTRRVFAISPHEKLPAGLAFLWFMALMSGYFIMRPIRETVAAELGSGELNRLFLFTFLAMLVAVPIYSKIVAMTTRSRLVAVVFGFLTLNVVGFAFWLHPSAATGDAEAAIEPNIGRVYFVWVSVYSLFSVSVFWSVLTDVFSNEQSKRLFGPIASGGTAGAIGGSLLAGGLARAFGIRGLLLVTFALLSMGVVLGVVLTRVVKKRQRDVGRPIPGVWAGFREILHSPFLGWICFYLALTSLAGTVVYMMMSDVIGQAIPQPEARTQFFARINLAVQLGTLLVQSVIVGPLMRRFGVATALMVLPTIYLASFLALGVHVGVWGLAVIDVARRIGAYGFTAPSREVLFTVVSRQAKYKSKNFIDTVVYRGSDTVASSLFTAATRWFASPHGIAWGMLPIAVGWMAIGWKLGHIQRRLARSPGPNEAGETSPAGRSKSHFDSENGSQ